MYGGKLLAFEIEGKRLRLNFYVCDVPYSVIRLRNFFSKDARPPRVLKVPDLKAPQVRACPLSGKVHFCFCALNLSALTLVSIRTSALASTRSLLLGRL